MPRYLIATISLFFAMACTQVYGGTTDLPAAPSHRTLMQTLNTISTVLTEAEQEDIRYFAEHLRTRLRGHLPEVDRIYHREAAVFSASAEAERGYRLSYDDLRIFVVNNINYRWDRSDIRLPQALTAYSVFNDFLSEFSGNTDPTQYRAALNVIMEASSGRTFEKPFSFNRGDMNLTIDGLRQAVINSMMAHLSTTWTVLTTRDLVMEYINSTSIPSIDLLNSEGPDPNALQGYNDLVWHIIVKETREGRGAAISQAFDDFLQSFRTLSRNQRPDLGGAIHLFFRLANNFQDYPGIDSLFETLGEALVYQLPISGLGTNQLQVFLSELAGNMRACMPADELDLDDYENGVKVWSHTPPTAYLVLQHPAMAGLFQQFLATKNATWAPETNELWFTTSVYLQRLRSIYGGVNLLEEPAVVTERARGLNEDEEYVTTSEGENVRTVARAVNNLDIGSLLEETTRPPDPCAAALDGNEKK